MKYYFSFSSGKYDEPELKKVYHFEDREHIDYDVYHSIRSNIQGLETFTDQLRWSKSITVSELRKLMSAPERNQRLINLERVNGQMVYTINIPTLPKGDPLLVRMSVKGLEDMGHESEPYLSATINCRIKNLVLRVEVPEEIVEEEAQYAVYRSFQNTVPVDKKTIKYDSDVKGFTYSEKYPIKGYRCVISWKFIESE